MKFSRLRLKVILMTGIFSGGVILFSCQESDQPVDFATSEGEILPVSLTINFSNEVDGYTLSADSRTRGTDHAQSAFSVKRLTETETRTEDLFPASLYNLEVRQYNGSTGAYMNGKTLGNTTIGSKVTIPLTVTDNCQLIIVARGDGNTVPELGTRSLSAVQKDITANSTVMQTLTDINKMPYVLHLKNVRVANAGNGNGTIQSTENATNDVRLRLKRLAARLTVSWTYSVADYDLQQILLQSIPLNYSVVSAPDASDGTYPSLLDQFTTISIPTVANSGSYTLWVPANVRGENAAATSLKQRTKSNSPVGSSFLNFIAVNNADTKKKLDYRIYLGGTKASEFNLEMGVNYNYQINFAHEGIPTDDNRITYIDPIPASEGNENFIPTANCFMVSPGGSFCFDPFMFRQNGVDIPNTVLAGWSTQIQSVKLLWQTKENGDVGNPVMGIVNTAHDHTNIVDIKNTDNTNAPYLQGKARIYCRVSANTTGGSGVIAAYDGPDGNGNILWTWHIWVTDYNPSPTGNATVLDPVNKRKLKFDYGNHPDQLPMMDRNLGAIAGYIDVPDSPVEKFKTHGFHYQWGRKDPYPSSYSSKEITNVDLPSVIDKPIDGILSLYQPDGVTFMPFSAGVDAQATYQNAYRHPLNIYKKKDVYRWLDGYTSEYNKAWSIPKGFHDPCPAGWRVAQISDYFPLFSDQNFSDPGKSREGNVNIKNSSTYSTDGGMVLYYDKNKTCTTYIRFTGYYYLNTQFQYIGVSTLLWTGGFATSSTVGSSVKYFQIRKSGVTGSLIYGGHEREAIPLRCIQEKAD